MSRLLPLARRFVHPASTRRLVHTGVANVLSKTIHEHLPEKTPSPIFSNDVGTPHNEMLSDLRIAVNKQSVSDTYEKFSRMKDAGRAESLAPEDLEAVDTLLAPSVFRTVRPRMQPELVQRTRPEPPRVQHTELVDSFEKICDVGLWLAVRGQICLLRSCMTYLLCRSDPKPQAVVDLYHTFSKRALAGEGSQKLRELPYPAPSLDASPNVEPTALQYHPGRPELIYLVIFAYTMLSDFRAAFHTARQAISPLRSDMARMAYASLIEMHEQTASQALLNVAKLDTLRLLSRPSSLRNHLTAIAETRSELKLDWIWNSITRLLRADDPWVGPLDESSGEPVIDSSPNARPLFSMSRQSWCDLIEAASALRPKIPKLTPAIWAEIERHGIEPTTGMWNALLAGYAMQGDLKFAQKIWNQMGDKRDMYTYTSLIQALFEWREPENAVKLFEQLKEFASKRREVVGIRSYNVLLHGLFINGRLQAAQTLASELGSNSTLPQPDTTTYNIQLRYYARKRDMTQLSRIMMTMSDRQVTPDVYTFATMLNALVREGVKDASSKILEMMRSFSVEPNAAIIGILIEDVVQARSDPYVTRPLNSQPLNSPKPEQLNLAMKLLFSFEDEAKVVTNEVNYTAIIAAFHRAAIGRQITHADADTAIKALRARMKKRKIPLNRVTYNILIAATLSGGNVPDTRWSELGRIQERERAHKTLGQGPGDRSSVPPNVQQAIKYLHEMRGAYILPNHDTWYILLSGVASWGQIGLARRLVDEMIRSDFIPQTGLLKLVMKIQGQS